MLLVFKFTVIYRRDTILTPHFLCQKPKIKNQVGEQKQLCDLFNTPMDFVLRFKEEGPVHAIFAYLSIVALIVKTKSMGRINVFELVLPANMKNQKKGLPTLRLNHDPTNKREKYHIIFLNEQMETH